MDVREELARVKVPAIALHCRGDTVVPFSDRFEERDSIARFGQHYEQYRKQVGMLRPWRRDPHASEGPALPGKGSLKPGAR